MHDIDPQFRENIATRLDRAPTLTINGAGHRTERSFCVTNPSSGSAICEAPIASKGDLDMAVAAARHAFPAWRNKPVAERRQIILAFCDILSEHFEEMALLLTTEQGKPISAARLEVDNAITWATSAANHDIRNEILEENDERKVEMKHTPIGVVGAIAPWNFPVLLSLWKVAPALIMGNTVVLKPSPYTPLTALRIGELSRAIFPPGVLNVISGEDNLGVWLTEHPGIDKISFTGSTETGRKVMRSASGSLKRITLELGGNDAGIILPDIDISKIVEDVFWSAFGNSGQVCMATKRLFVHSDIYHDVANAMVEYSKKVILGDGKDEAVGLGPIQNRKQFEKVRDLISKAKSRGERFLCGGNIPDGDGLFVPVTIVDNPDDASPVVAEEAFGPVLPLLRFDHIDEVVERANATSYGLGATIWSSNVEKAEQLAARLECGSVWINGIYITPDMPFGGHKQSGIGVECGRYGLNEYANLQVVVTNFKKLQ